MQGSLLQLASLGGVASDASDACLEAHRPRNRCCRRSLLWLLSGAEPRTTGSVSRRGRQRRRGKYNIRLGGGVRNPLCWATTGASCIHATLLVALWWPPSAATGRRGHALWLLVCHIGTLAQARVNQYHTRNRAIQDLTPCKVFVKIRLTRCIYRWDKVSTKIRPPKYDIVIPNFVANAECQHSVL